MTRHIARNPKATTKLCRSKVAFIGGVARKLRHKEKPADLIGARVLVKQIRCRAVGVIVSIQPAKNVENTLYRLDSGKSLLRSQFAVLRKANEQ